ncbi:ATP-dependent RNA helicase p62-like [Elysia marginata]|uniref:ATP-dependent RNA helicase p62-like n=1 Tax=Elysia marginata TaxID=1093978 RepID=A0AAV4EXQ8_9GAST|nr:ATP-dependent RNA helicase p62-like [Elysia marginata]
MCVSSLLWTGQSRNKAVWPCLSLRCKPSCRAKVGKTASTLHKWKLRPNSECPCGNQKQTMDHILSECTEGPHCTDQDLRDCTDAAQAWITHWRDKI